MESTAKILEGLFVDIIKHNLTAEANQWLQEKAALVRADKNATQLNLAFAAVPRKTGRRIIELTQDEQRRTKEIHSDLIIGDWTIDRLTRVWLLWQADANDRENYFKKLENLFKAAEMNELVALYTALPGFYYAEEWQKQCAEGIRSNIGIVLEAIMYNNLYPYKYLNGQAWNQLVLKAFFTDKDVNRIIGLDERANKELASILIDYANERWAAHRSVDPQLWRLVAQFIAATNYKNIERAFESSPLERKAAALACFNSNYEPAKKLLDKDPVIKKAIIENKLNWGSLQTYS